MLNSADNLHPLPSYQNGAHPPVFENKQEKDRENNCNGIVAQRYHSKEMLYLLFGGIMMIIATIFIGSHQSQEVLVDGTNNLVRKVRQCNNDSDCVKANGDGYICEKSGPNRCYKRSDQTNGKDCSDDHDCAVGYWCQRFAIVITGTCSNGQPYCVSPCPPGQKCFFDDDPGNQHPISRCYDFF